MRSTPSSPRPAWLARRAAWGRYAGLMDYNTKTGMVFVPKDEDDIDNA
nr:hypothetical protein [Herbaspirillum sp. ASV7]